MVSYEWFGCFVFVESVMSKYRMVWTACIVLGSLLCLVWVILSPYSINDNERNVDQAFDWGSSAQGSQLDTQPEQGPITSLDPLENFDEIQTTLIRSQDERLWLYIP